MLPVLYKHVLTGGNRVLAGENVFLITKFTHRQQPALNVQYPRSGPTL